MAEAKTPALSLPVTKGAHGRAHRTLWQDASRRFFRNRLAIAGFVIVAAILFMAVFADFLAPYSYDEADFNSVLVMPFTDPAHPLGTDQVGRDFLSRLIYGARTSMVVGFTVATFAVLIGVTLGGLAGFMGGTVDFLISRVIDVMTAFPGLLFAILLVTVTSAMNFPYSQYLGGLFTVVLALSITSWIGISRLTRGQLLSLREKEYIEAARSLGVPRQRIIFGHLVPNALSPLLVALTFLIPAAIFAESGLSFLGIGINDPIPSWGKMVGESQGYMRVYWHLALFPTLLIALTMLGFVFVGDGIRDALDPKLIE